jgi:hypothetical protein
MNMSFAKRVLCAMFVSIVFQSGLPAQALIPDETTTITLDQAVHFLGTDGSDVVAEPGNYSVEAAQEWLRLIPGTERRDALLIEAQQGTHEVKVEIPILISTPGTEPDETDVHVVQLLNPDGTSMVATGTYSGIQSRGIGDAAKQAAARAQAAAEAARRAAAAKAQQTADAARIAALKAKQEVERIAKEAVRFAQLNTCLSMVNAMKGVRLSPANVTQVREGKSKQDALAKWRQSADIKRQIKEKTAQFIGAHNRFIPELKRIHQWLNNPQNRNAVEDLFNADTLCKARPTDIEAKLTKYGLRPKVAIPASASDNHFYIGFSRGVTAAVVGGVVAGRQIVTDFRGNTMKLLSVGPAVTSNAAISATVGVMFYPSSNRAAFGGWSAGLGVSGGFPGVDIGAAVDFAFGQKPAILGTGFVRGIVNEFQGFGLGATAGLSVIPVDGTNSYAYTWELPWWVP